MIRLRLQEGDLTTFELPAGKHRIGRSRHAAISLQHASVSNEHCEITVDPLIVLVTDLGSTNGTFINGEPVRKAEILNGQILHVGHVPFLMEREIQNVVVPEMTLERPEDLPTTLPNGAPCCHNHRTLAASMKCGACTRMFCGACVTRIGLVGGNRHLLCPICHGHCHPYEWDGGVRRGWLHGMVKSVKKITSNLLRPPRATERSRGRR